MEHVASTYFHAVRRNSPVLTGVVFGAEIILHIFECLFFLRTKITFPHCRARVARYTRLARLSHNVGITAINTAKRYAVFSQKPLPTRDYAVLNAKPGGYKLIT
jgi:hypothetical protein